MKTTIKDQILHIEIPMHSPRPSSTGKTLTIASSNGNQPTEARVNGQQVIVGECVYQARELNSETLEHWHMFQGLFFTSIKQDQGWEMRVRGRVSPWSWSFGIGWYLIV